MANINLVQVPDDGAPIGSSGDQQGDPNFGDIRIGGMEQSLSQLAFAFLPPAYNGGTNAGDIFFNTAQSWQTNGTAYDLLTVAIHEFGHALGMAHSQIVTACMYANYQGTNQSLTSDDVAGIQSIYSTPPPEGSNTSHDSALNITPDINGNGQIALPNQTICTNVDTKSVCKNNFSKTDGDHAAKWYSSIWARPIRSWRSPPRCRARRGHGRRPTQPR